MKVIQHVSPTTSSFTNLLRRITAKEACIRRKQFATQNNFFRLVTVKCQPGQLNETVLRTAEDFKTCQLNLRRAMLNPKRYKDLDKLKTVLLNVLNGKQTMSLPEAINFCTATDCLLEAEELLLQYKKTTSALESEFLEPV
jgi:hypothetical protein